MKNNQQTFHLLFDISLFTGFIIAFLLDWTGVINHQWLGIAVIAGSLIHLLWHSAWVKNVLQRFAALSDKLLITFFVDAGLAFGFTGILMTGLILSTWLNLPLRNYLIWFNLHIAFSIETLVVLVIKTMLHWRWIGTAIRNLFHRPAPLPSPLHRAPTGAVPQLSGGKMISRRDFLAVAGVTGLASWLAISAVLREISQPVAQEATTNEIAEENSTSAEPTATLQQETDIAEIQSTTASTVETPTDFVATAQPTQVVVEQPTAATVCYVRCNHHCSYPGQCRRYIDSNGNGLCDNGECL